MDQNQIQKSMAALLTARDRRIALCASDAGRIGVHALELANIQAGIEVLEKLTEKPKAAKAAPRKAEAPIDSKE